MKIYFAGSIRGGRQDSAIYQEIIQELGRFGQVLTEHIGQANLSNQGESLPFSQIFQRDLAWLKEADVLVAEVTTPSAGVGYEIGLAESLNKRVLCLYREAENSRVSGMILGNPNITIKLYQDIQQVKEILTNFFKSQDGAVIRKG